HPLLLTHSRLWNTQWALRPGSPSMIVDDMRIHDARYGLFLEEDDRHAYRRLVMSDTQSPRSTSGAFARVFASRYPPGNGLRPGEQALSAHAEDAAGNVEKQPHTLRL